ncbi:hypothetical protein M409DRAFT_30739 [Zasmidium cellare ATCC 36951]|uniref:EthD domain-containing protein n=1 Tax=Zasmidium cellare ATCC 36951 TaxID=1080233 RepID=A0A6A6BVI4_ZASCE|nr:uncharacterized protein M409DRAFT_30739 [Zasmidium cellare ATCC 36951]KAF2158781.1 hypothetical protein M409DRAFT_30739 [Zasmidium cellare ATCC 36951]
MSTTHPQFLIKRRTGSTPEEFSNRWFSHGHLVLPWQLSNGVQYYAQIHRPVWASSEAAASNPGVDLSDWDGAAEMVFREHTDLATATAGARYFEDVIVKDELEFLHSKSTSHAKAVGGGSISGDRVEFIKDGKPLVEFEKWQELYEQLEGTSDQK